MPELTAHVAPRPAARRRTVANACSSCSSSAARPTSGVARSTGGTLELCTAARSDGRSRPIAREDLARCAAAASGSRASSAEHSRTQVRRQVGREQLGRRRIRAAASGCIISIAAPVNGSRPVSASYSITPTAYQSLASLTGSPAACSGAMYAGVPLTAVLRHALERAGIGDEAEVEHDHAPSRVTSTFDGLRSRCSLPAAWIAHTPCASWASASRSSAIRGRPRPGSTARAVGPAPRASRTVTCACTACARRVSSSPRSAGGAASGVRTNSRKELPRSSSIVKNHCAPLPTSSWSRTKFGCTTSASDRNSCLSRPMSAAPICGSSLSATTRSCSRSNASYTTPAPPSPRRSRSSKRSVSSCSCSTS